MEPSAPFKAAAPFYQKHKILIWIVSSFVLLCVIGLLIYLYRVKNQCDTKEIQNTLRVSPLEGECVLSPVAPRVSCQTLDTGIGNRVVANVSGENPAAIQYKSLDSNYADGYPCVQYSNSAFISCDSSVNSYSLSDFQANKTGKSYTVSAKILKNKVLIAQIEQTDLAVSPALLVNPNTKQPLATIEKIVSLVPLTIRYKNTSTSNIDSWFLSFFCAILELKYGY